MTEQQTPHDAADVPLVLDVDGTLLRTDLLYETFWAALACNLFATMRILLTWWTRPERLKHELRRIADPQLELLPVRDQVLDMARAAQSEGRAVHLASGSDQGLVDALAGQLDLPGSHFGSTPERNLTDGAKATLLVGKFGQSGFDYAGNAVADLRCWENARRIIAVAPGPALMRQLRAMGKPVEIVADGWHWRDLIRELRPHQWIKNLLLFLPLLAAHQFQPDRIATVAVAVVAFSLGASSIYIINDLLDLEADRQHPSKCNRPIASGRLPIQAAMIACLGLAVVALGLAFLAHPAVAAMTAGYMASSLIYSLWLKKLRWVDVLTLAVLFLMRVITGGLAADISLSSWLLAVVFTVFLGLAIVKRLTGLSRLQFRAHLPGRGYDRDDFRVLLRLGYLSAGASMVLFLGYAVSPNAALLYRWPAVLVLAVVPMGLWLVRAIRLSAQGLEDYDPVIFVTRDLPGLALIAGFLALLVLAS